MNINELIYLDLFSGVGGFAKGLNDAGLKIKKHYFSEIDKNAIAVYKYNFKDSEYAGDIRTISNRTITERPNIITFGFPCQDLSVAGNGKGLSGARSGLFFEAVRLIIEFKPEVFIFENVKGLLSNNEGKDFELVLRTIADIGLYGCEWQLVNTSWVLPQNRERVYFVGHLTGASRPEVFPFTKADFGVAQRQSNTSIVRTITAGGHSGGHHSGHHSGMTIIQVNDKQNFGKSTKQQDRVYSPDGLMACLGSHRLESKCNIEVKAVLTPDRAEKRQNGRRFKDNGEPAFTLNTQDMHGVQIDNTIRRLTEIECERLQGFPDDWTRFGDYDGIVKEVAKTQRYKQLGNAVTTDMPRMIAERLSIFQRKSINEAILST